MNSTEDYPIGFFDSGIGGTSIWKEVHKLLPNENTIYLADSKNAPYGDKSKDKIISYVPHGLNDKIYFPINKTDKQIPIINICVLK